MVWFNLFLILVLSRGASSLGFVPISNTKSASYNQTKYANQNSINTYSIMPPYCIIYTYSIMPPIHFTSGTQIMGLQPTLTENP